MSFLLFGHGYWGKKIKTVLDQKGEVIIVDPKGFLHIEEGFELLNNSEISDVFIASPEETHYDLVKRSLLAGNNTYVEKPLCLYEHEAEELFNLAQKKQLKLFVDYIFLHDLGLKEIKKIIMNDEIGDIVRIKSVRHSIDIHKPNIHVTDDLAIHDIYIFQYLVGARIDSALVLSKIKQNLFVTEAQVRYSIQGIEAFGEYSWITGIKKRELLIEGKKGSILWSNEKVVVTLDSHRIEERIVSSENKHSTLEVVINSYLETDYLYSTQVYKEKIVADISTLEEIRNLF